MRILRYLFALLLLAMSVTAQAQPNFPKRDREPVVDAANLLNPAQEAELASLAEDINKTSTRQFVVATIPDLQGYPIEDYGYQLGRAWGIGQKDANNGILLIVAPNERKVRIEVGYGLEPIMTDAMANSIIEDTILPRFKAGDMPGGIVAGAQAIGAQMKLPLEAAEARARAEADKKVQSKPRRSSGGGFPIGLIFWGILFLFVLLPMFARGFGGRRQRGPWGVRRYRSNDGGALPIILWSIANEIGRSSGGSSSGWGGGSDGGGGGGGGFSGGGGSFGCGGASGSW